MTLAIPWRRMALLEQRYKDILDYKNLSVKYENVKTGKTVVAGGYWDSIAGGYSKLADVKTAKTTCKLSVSQWQMLMYAIEAMGNKAKLLRDQAPITTLVVHAPRRGGKSYGLAAVLLLVMLAKPGASCWLVGLRKKHGENIIKTMRKYLHHRAYDHNRREGILTLINGSVISARSEQNYNQDRGESLDVYAIDEAAFMDETVYEAGVSSILDRAGFSILASSPNMLNYFYRLANRAIEDDPIAPDVIKVVHLKANDNVFVSHLEKIRKYLKYTMSADAYKQEAEGEFVQFQGRVLPSFDRLKHVRDYHQIDNYTPALTDNVFSRIGARNWIVGVDYNVNPTVGVICQFDRVGAIWYLAEVLTPFGTEVFGEQLYVKLLELGAIDPYQEAMIIGDASGEYQDNKDKDHQSATILRQQGWTVIRPRASRRDNPGVIARMEVIRALHYSAAGEIRMFIDPSCSNLIQCFDELALKNNKPDKGSKLNHIYDAATYPAYRIWGTGAGKSTYQHNLVQVSRGAQYAHD